MNNAFNNNNKNHGNNHTILKWVKIGIVNEFSDRAASSDLNRCVRLGLSSMKREFNNFYTLLLICLCNEFVVCCHCSYWPRHQTWSYNTAPAHHLVSANMLPTLVVSTQPLPATFDVSLFSVSPRIFVFSLSHCLWTFVVSRHGACTGWDPNPIQNPIQNTPIFFNKVLKFLFKIRKKKGKKKLLYQTVFIL